MNQKLLAIFIILIFIIFVFCIILLLYFYVCNFYYKIIKKSKEITAIPYRQKLKKLQKISNYNLRYLNIYQEVSTMFFHIKNNYLFSLSKSIDELNDLFKKKKFISVWKNCKKISLVLNELKLNFDVLLKKIDSSLLEEENFRLEINKYKDLYQKLSNYYRKKFLEFEFANAALSSFNKEIEELFLKSETLLKVADFDKLKEILKQLNYYLNILLEISYKLPYYYNLVNVIIVKKFKEIEDSFLELTNLNFNLNKIQYKNFKNEINLKIEELNNNLANLNIDGINFDILDILKKINEIKKELTTEKCYFDFVFYFAKKIDELILKLQKKRIKNNSKINAIFSFYDLEDTEKKIFIDSRNSWDTLLQTFDEFKNLLQAQTNSWSKFSFFLDKLLEEFIQTYNFIVIESKFLLSLKSIEYYKQELIKLKNLLFELKAKESDHQYSPFFNEYLDNLNSYLKEIKKLYNFLFQPDKKIKFIYFQEQFEILSSKVIEIIYKFKTFSESIVNAEKLINIANKFRNLSDSNETDLSKAEYLYKIKNYELAKKLALYVIRKNDPSILKNIDIKNIDNFI